MKMDALSQQEAAKLCGVTSRTLRDWPQAPRNDDGTYNGPVLIAWLIDRRAGRDLDLTAERARLAAVQADAGELKLKVARGELKPLDTVIDELGSIIAHANAKLRQLPHAIGQFCPASERGRIVAQAARIIKEALDDLAKGTAEVLARPADSDGEPVGGQLETPLNGGKRRTRTMED